jgi:hypothetical protein
MALRINKEKYMTQVQQDQDFEGVLNTQQFKEIIRDNNYNKL